MGIMNETQAMQKETTMKCRILTALPAVLSVISATAVPVNPAPPMQTAGEDGNGTTEPSDAAGSFRVGEDATKPSSPMAALCQGLAK